MAKAYLISTNDVELRLRQRYNQNQKLWLSGGGEWPIQISLGIPTEKQAINNLPSVQAWQKRWLEWQGEGDIKWVERRWPTLGTQKLPEKIVISDALQVVRWIGQENAWGIAKQRYLKLIERWPRLAQVITKFFKVLTDYNEDDFNRLFSALEWLETHPKANLYIRQLPIEGIDTKWVASRKAVVTELLKTIRGFDKTSDFYQITGIRREPDVIRFRLLDEKLRNMMAGLTDLSAPVGEINAIRLPIKKIFIVENLQTGLAFNDIPGALVFMRLGYAVDLCSKIKWLNDTPVYYWGDIDTHGFAMLNRLRGYFSHVRSILMDEATFIAHKKLWVEEETPVINADLNTLTTHEIGLYNDLCNNRWGMKLRLEQERILWDYAWSQIRAISQK